MIDQFTIGHITNAFDRAEQGDISEQARNRIAYCRKLIKHAEDAELLQQANAYSAAIGSAEIKNAEYAQHFIDMIAGDCAVSGNE